MWEREYEQYIKEQDYLYGWGLEDFVKEMLSRGKVADIEDLLSLADFYNSFLM